MTREEKIEALINYWFKWQPQFRKEIIGEEPILGDIEKDVVYQILKALEEIGPSPGSELERLNENWKKYGAP